MHLSTSIHNQHALLNPDNLISLYLQWKFTNNNLDPNFEIQTQVQIGYGNVKFVKPRI